MSLQLMKDVLTCSECIEVGLSREPEQTHRGGERNMRDYHSIEEVWEHCREMYCSWHSESWMRDIFLPLINSYHRGHNEASGDVTLSDQKLLDDIIHEMRNDQVLWIIKTMMIPSRISIPMASIRALLKHLRNSVALDDEDHVDTLLSHVLNTLRNTGEVAYEGHLLDIVTLAQDHPDVVWSQQEGGDIRRHHLMLTMALKIPRPSVVGRGFARHMEWVVSAIIARFYGAEIHHLATLENHLKDCVPTYQADSDYLTQVHPYQEGSYIKRFGETCNLLFDWVEFIRSRDGEEMSMSTAVGRVFRYQGIVRPRSLETLSRRVRASQYMEVEFSEEKILRWMAVVSKLDMGTPDPDDIASFDLDVETYLKWAKNSNVYRPFKGTHVDTYDLATEWIVSFGRHGISQDRLRELAMTGVPLDWVLATHGKA